MRAQVQYKSNSIPFEFLPRKMYVRHRFPYINHAYICRRCNLLGVKICGEFPFLCIRGGDYDAFLYLCELPEKTHTKAAKKEQNNTNYFRLITQRLHKPTISKLMRVLPLLLVWHSMCHPDKGESLGENLKK